MIISFRILRLAVPPLAHALGLAASQSPPLSMASQSVAATHAAPDDRQPASDVPRPPRDGTRPVVRAIPSPVERAALGPSLAY
jgi:hypothetical protein